MLERSESCNEVRLLGVRELCNYLSMGRNKAVEFAKNAGSERRIGRRCLYDKAVIDEAIDNLCQVKEAYK